MEPVRKPTLRWRGFDYASAAWYYVTICLDPRRPILGRVVGPDTVALTRFGEIVQEEILALAARYPHVRIDTAIVMPDHLHLLIVFERRNGRVTLGDVVCRFKLCATIRINAERRTPGAKVFQRGYFDRVLRDPEEIAAKREYIRLNPRRWWARRNER